MFLIVTDRTTIRFYIFNDVSEKTRERNDRQRQEKRIKMNKTFNSISVLLYAKEVCTNLIA
jgi:hypothetical protein